MTQAFGLGCYNRAFSPEYLPETLVHCIRLNAYSKSKRECGLHHRDHSQADRLGQIRPGPDHRFQAGSMSGIARPLFWTVVYAYRRFGSLVFLSTPEWIRTTDRRIRNPLLYPAELRAHERR